MKKNVTISLIILFILSGIRLFAQDEIIKENRPVKSFSAISVAGIAHVYLTKADNEKVDVEVNNKEFNERLVIEVIDNVLTIKMKPRPEGNQGKLYNNVKLRVNVSYKDLNSIQAGGATHLYSENAVVSNKLTIQTSGANNTKLEIKASETNVETSGASNLTLSGTSPQFNARTSGASNIKAYNLSSEDVKAEASGTSNIFVTASKTIGAKASGVSNVNYKGDANVVNRELSRMANLNKR